MTVVFAIELCNSLLWNARIGYENTQDMRALIVVILRAEYCGYFYAKFLQVIASSFRT